MPPPGRRAPPFPSGRVVALALALGLALPAGASELRVWVDEEGRTHLTDDPERVPAGAHPVGADEVERLGALWQGRLRGPPVETPPGATSSEEDRLLRQLRTALDDLRRGERARATSALRDVLRREPDRAEAHWYLALLEGRRGHLDAAEGHLRDFLASAGAGLERWRASARERLDHLEDERALLREAEPELRRVARAHPHFEIRVDASLLETGASELVRRVVRYLEEARAALGKRLDARPAEPTGVVLYGKGAYRSAHAARFDFKTVGFFDGRIHVASAAHPAGELRALLFHEYAHALFRERTAGDRPYWLNEGLAQLAAREAQGLPPQTRSDRERLRRALEAETWIPLARLGPGFSGLDDERARLAYRIARAAASWVEAHTAPEERGRLLGRLGEGWSADRALREVVGRGVAGVDAALRTKLRASFP